MANPNDPTSPNVGEFNENDETQTGESGSRLKRAAGEVADRAKTVAQKVVDQGKQRVERSALSASSALRKAAETPGIGGRVYNVGAGRRTSVLDLIAALNRQLGSNVTPNFSEPRTGDIRHSRADISRAQRDLHYEPAVAFEEGLAKTLQWYRGG